jgi:hypothetical protein
MTSEKNLPELDDFLTKWDNSAIEMKNGFLVLADCLLAMADVSLEFNARPGVSYSLRPKHINQKERNLFAMVDVIDDEPDARWLSVCFYGDMISDPDEAGEVIPGGLAGDDGYCFDVFEYDEAAINYIKDRLLEACKSVEK